MGGGVNFFHMWSLELLQLLQIMFLILSFLLFFFLILTPIYNFLPAFCINSFKCLEKSETVRKLFSITKYCKSMNNKFWFDPLFHIIYLHLKMCCVHMSFLPSSFHDRNLRVCCESISYNDRYKNMFSFYNIFTK